MSEVFIYYLCIVNIIAFILFGVDKQRAIHKCWRIPEFVLLMVALAGGAAGSLIGMITFRHKIRHVKFLVFVPLFLLIHIALIVVRIV